MPKKTKYTNIWKFLTPLDSTHLEIFLGILFFKFIIQIWKHAKFFIDSVICVYRPVTALPDQLTGSNCLH
jgi:hypothetical protein